MAEQVGGPGQVMEDVPLDSMSAKILSKILEID